MALICNFDFNTSPMNPFHGLDYLNGPASNSFAPDEEDAIHFQLGRVTPVSSVTSSIVEEDFDLEPVPIAAYKNPYYQAHLQTMLRESVGFLFGAPSQCEEGSKKRKMSDGGVSKKRRRSEFSEVSDYFSDDSSRSSGSSGSDGIRFRPYQNLQW
ncbi:MAG: hypothetical protein SGBAC_007591, partial [Bacillariaceae sp.]